MRRTVSASQALSAWPDSLACQRGAYLWSSWVLTGPTKHLTTAGPHGARYAEVEQKAFRHTYPPLHNYICTVLRTLWHRRII